MTSTTIMHRAASVFGAACIALALGAFSSSASAQAKAEARRTAATDASCQGGYVHEVSGLTSMRRAAGKAVVAKVGDLFESGAVFRTGPNEKVVLKFADGQVVALGANSVLRIGRYCYLASGLGQSTIRLELMKGEMRLVTGLIGAAHREGIQITAGASIIEIQKPGGADFTVAVKPDPQEAGYAVIALGEVSVRTPYGPIYSIASGQYAPWQPGRAPALPMPLAAAPAVIQAAATNFWTTVLPASTPVALAAAANAAAANAASAQAQANANLRLAGYVQAISNTVAMQTAYGKTAQADVGSTFEPGATFNTGSDGRVVLKFADGQLVVLGPGSTLAVAQYQFDPGNIKESRSALELANGAMRIVTGNIHTDNHAGESISAGASQIDILNLTPADFTVAVDTRDQEIGVVRVALGEISVRTPYGLIGKIALDQSNLWGPGKTDAIPVAQALAVVQAAVSLQLSGLPDNAPVAVAEAASAAAARAAANSAQAAASADPQNLQLQLEATADAEMADLTTQAALAASEAIAGRAILAALGALPATASGPALAQAPSVPIALASAPILPTVTPGAGGGCTGSVC